MFAWHSSLLEVRNTHSPSASVLGSTDSICVRICSIDNTKKKWGSKTVKLKRILKMHKIHIETRTRKCYCCSEFCWRVLRTYTWLKCLWLPFASVLRDLTFCINMFNPGMKCTVYKEVMEDVINVIGKQRAS